MLVFVVVVIVYMLFSLTSFCLSVFQSRLLSVSASACLLSALVLYIISSELKSAAVVIVSVSLLNHKKCL